MRRFRDLRKIDGEFYCSEEFVGDVARFWAKIGFVAGIVVSILVSLLAISLA